MTPFDCPNCKGTGRIWGKGPANELKPSPCSSCGGSGIDPELKDRMQLALHIKRGDYVPTNERVQMEALHCQGCEDEIDAVLASVVAYWKEKE